MTTLGTTCLGLAFAASLIGVVLYLISAKIKSPAKGAKGVEGVEGANGAQETKSKPDRFALIGRISTIATFAALTISCALIVFCFFSGENSLQYVVEYRSKSQSDLLWFYTLSGLWAGREGSLLFWAWLMSAFGLFSALRSKKKFGSLDALALSIAQIVLCAFIGVLLFSDENMPFAASSSTLVNDDGSLTSTGELYGLNPLLEHWAMAIHPPTLFVGYAGLAIPFAYAFAAIILGDDSDKWICRTGGIVRFSWLFLGIGIGLGSVWAYVVLGWGGYWGWDPVENASLLSWIVCTALVHSMTVVSRHGSFKRWAITCACFSFMFVIVGTFISRSGLVQSVHAFTGDAVSLAFFLVLIAATFLAGIFGAIGRPKSFAPKDDNEEESSYLSREMGYFLLNVIMMMTAFVLAYLTLASALPEWMPFGGQSMESSTYNSLARPLGILLMAIIVICPLLGWKHTNPSNFWKLARIPAIFAVILFALLMVFFVTNLLPAYDATLSAGDSSATTLAESGPSWYYNGLAVVGFIVASLLVFNSLFMLIRMLKTTRKSKNTSLALTLRRRASTIGGLVAHLAMGIILIGMIGSSMYVTEETAYIASSDTSDASESLEIQNYTLTPISEDSWQEGDYTYMYELSLDVYRDGEYFCSVSPTIQYQLTTQQQKLNAVVVSMPTHDLFVVYRGVNDSGDYSLDVRVNPLINLVWIGFALLMIGTALALFSKAEHKPTTEPEPALEPEPAITPEPPTAETQAEPE